MGLENYSKDYSQFFNNHKQANNKRVGRLFYILMAIFGLGSIAFATLPAVFWNLSTGKRLGAKIENLPVPTSEVIVENPLTLGNIQVVKDPDGFTYFTTTYNPPKETEEYKLRPQEFYISIPKLKIERAITKVDSLNFKNNLSHFPATALPGEIGNSFITGHSSLPQFANPKDYDSIFTKLPSLKIGDEVYVDIDGKNLKFLVQFLKVVDPQDLSVLAPISKTGRNLTLMTCVPPGTSTKRLVVITSLI